MVLFLQICFSSFSKHHVRTSLGAMPPPVHSNDSVSPFCSEVFLKAFPSKAQLREQAYYSKFKERANQLHKKPEQRHWWYCDEEGHEPSNPQSKVLFTHLFPAPKSLKPIESGSSPSPVCWHQQPGWDDFMLLWWEGRILIPVSERGPSPLSLPKANHSTRLTPSAPAAPFPCWMSFLFSTLLTASPVWALLSSTSRAGLAFTTALPVQPSTSLTFRWGKHRWDLSKNK